MEDRFANFKTGRGLCANMPRVPVHGEAAHLAANADVAKAAGVPQQLTGLNGDLFVLAPVPRLWPGFVKAGRIALVR